MREQDLLTAEIITPLGKMTIVANYDGICLLEFDDRKIIDKEFNHLERYFNASISEGTNNHIENLKTQLAECFEGKRKVFDIPVVFTGSNFQNKVWKALLDIPYGETRSYKQQSVTIGNMKAIRAVAHANGCNLLAIIVPCHRVIGNNGDLTGYGGGIKRKQWLLELENNNSSPKNLRLFHDL